MTTNGLTDDKIRSALNYSIQKGYTEGNPAQVELAVWFLRDSTWHATDHTVAQEIVNNATSANAPSTTGDGISLNDAVTQKKVTINATFIAQTAGHFYGDSTVQITNSGTADVKIFMPVGTLFTIPNGGGQFQDLAAYALGPQGTQQAVPATTTPELTTTAVATDTVAVATDTVAVATDTVAVATDTVAVSTVTAVATDTVAVATDTVAVPTATEVATAVPATPTAMATPTSAPSTLPQTGNAGGGMGGTLGALAALAGFMLVVLGFVIRPKQSKRQS